MTMVYAVLVRDNTDVDTETLDEVLLDIFSSKESARAMVESLIEDEIEYWGARGISVKTKRTNSPSERTEFFNVHDTVFCIIETPLLK